MAQVVETCLAGLRPRAQSWYEGRREGGREGRKEGGKEEVEEGGREGGKEGRKDRFMQSLLQPYKVSMMLVLHLRKQAIREKHAYVHTVCLGVAGI
jgi:flagellar biosynthesis/type III secretory pathway protein FliH